MSPEQRLQDVGLEGLPVLGESAEAASVPPPEDALMEDAGVEASGAEDAVADTASSGPSILRPPTTDPVAALPPPDDPPLDDPSPNFDLEEELAAGSAGGVEA